MKLVATKPLTYRTRRLLPGDPFEVPTTREGRIWVEVLKKACEAPISDTAPAPDVAARRREPRPAEKEAVAAEPPAAIEAPPAEEMPPAPKSTVATATEDAASPPAVVAPSAIRGSKRASQDSC